MISQASERQFERYKNIDNVDLNGQVHFNTSALLLLSKEIELFNRMQDQSHLSSRSQIGCITLARTIADFEDSADVKENHMQEAMELRRYGLGDYYWRSLR